MSMDYRRKQAQELRHCATELAAHRPHPSHRSNGEEVRYRRGAKERSYIANFTKGLPHRDDGMLLNPADYRQFVRGIQSGQDTDFRLTPLGPADTSEPTVGLSTPAITPGTSDTVRRHSWKSAIAKGPEAKDAAQVRAWESQAAGLIFDLQGPDAQAVTMPPAPHLDSKELAAEMAEVYVMALLRDEHFSQLRDAGLGTQHPNLNPNAVINVADAEKQLCMQDWFSLNDPHALKEGQILGRTQLTDEERRRHRGKETLDRQGLFRGFAPGDRQGPYLSQFLLLGNTGLGDAHDITDGYIQYGSIRVDQRVRVATPGKDYMTTFEEWLDVQNGADVRGRESYEGGPSYRFITTPRDLATYVHYDALYEAYLNACLVLLGMGAPLDPGLPFQEADVADRQQPFASFGGPHILSLVTEVATRALKAVRYQKFNIHRRLRPEGVAGLVDRYCNDSDLAEGELAVIAPLVSNYTNADLLHFIKQHNANQRSAQSLSSDHGDSYLLPMAFPEGSPMHPSYGAGHATVAGACVTILKAFFDHGWELRDKNGDAFAYEPNADGSALDPLAQCPALTVEGELNKLAANIAIGRDWAGVHYYTDYIESLRMGEQIALGILEEQRLTYGENFTMTVPLFDGGVVNI